MMSSYIDSEIQQVLIITCSSKYDWVTSPLTSNVPPLSMVMRGWVPFADSCYRKVKVSYSEKGDETLFESLPVKLV